MPRLSNFPISRAWELRVILEFLESKDVPWRSLAGRAGLPQRLPEARSFLPTRVYYRFLGELSLAEQFPEMTLVCHLNGEGRLAIGKPMPLVVRNFLSAATLYTALCRLGRDAKTHWSNLRFWIEEGEDQILWCSRSTTSFDPQGLRLMVQNRVALMIASLQYFLGFEWRPDTLYLECDAMPSALLADLLDVPRVITSAPFTGFSIYRSLLANKGPLSGAPSGNYGNHVPDTVCTEWSWARRLQSLLPAYALEPQFCLETMAEAAQVHPRTLQRALREEGYSFRELAEQARMEIARDHLSSQSLSVTEIAELLGYTEETNFARAFRRWSGQSPTAFRDQSSS